MQLLLKQTAKIISTYTADVSGICSALFELGGMTVMHDASGCNSTYNTHDEPRWYDTDSMVYVSGLSEMEAIMGDDEKLISDIIDAANELNPKFIAVAGSPIPMVTGTDFPAVASIIETRTGIPAFGFPTNGMHSYLSGVGMALSAIADRFCHRGLNLSKAPSVNILGVTPLDFSVNGSVDSMEKILEQKGFNVISRFAMGSSLDNIADAGMAHVNLVVSYAGLATARKLKAIFGTPYVIGTPYGEKFSSSIAELLRKAAESGECIVAYKNRPVTEKPYMTIIGESIMSCSLAAAIWEEANMACRVICPLETEEYLLDPGDSIAADEDEIIPLLRGGNEIVIADPLYSPILPEETRFISLPHEAFSGRIYQNEIPNIIGNSDFSRFIC